MEDFDAVEPANVDQPAGAFIAVRRTVLETVGGMDGGLFILFEDADRCRRIRDAGWALVHIPEAEIVHGKSRSLVKRGVRLNLDFALPHDVWAGFLLRAAFGLDAAVEFARRTAAAGAGSGHAVRGLSFQLRRAALHAGILS